MHNLDFKNKRVVIFGLGSYEYGSGISAAKFFIKHGAHVLITDKKIAQDLRKPIDNLKKFARKYHNQLLFVLGDHREKDFKNADIVLRNPGVPADNKFLKIARKAGAKIHTDVSLFFKILQTTHYPLLTKIIGITGTRGKSTTSALVAHILQVAGYKVFLGGNMGYSPLNFLDKLQTTNSDKAVIILELSSWLVESLDDYKISPHYALVTNIYPDHLNTYSSIDKYVAAKEIIFKYQSRNDVLFLNKDNSYTRAMAQNARSRIVWFSRNDAEIRRISRGNTQNFVLAAEHNLENFAAARAMARSLGVGNQKIFRTIKNFKGLPGRLELIHTWRGIKFYNDTTSTMPEATIVALHTLQATNRIILIAGGADKKLDYKKLAKKIPKYVKALILLKGEASEKLKLEIRNKKFEKGDTVTDIGSMKIAVRYAMRFAKRGDIVLLSPGAASFNMFRNEFDRGGQFEKIVKNL